MGVWGVLSTPLRRMSVCPHDTARNVYGWFFINSYLQSILLKRATVDRSFVQP
jgi:hypothetical protein